MARSVTAIETLVQNIVDFINNDLYLGALTTAGVTGEVCFDCTLWNTGYKDATGTVIIPPIKTTLSNLIGEAITELQTEIASTAITDYGFKTQMERFLNILMDLENRVSSVQCNNACGDTAIISQLLVTIVTTVTELLSIFEILNGLLSYMGTCACMGSKLFEILMGKFINAVSGLQGVMMDWYGIVMTFFQLSSIQPRSYVAAYVPGQQITPPPMPAPVNYACVPVPRPQCYCQ